MEEKNIPMVPKHWAEMMMVHMSRAIRTIAVAFVVGFSAMVLMAYIFVTAYTSRTKEWLNTYMALQGTTSVTEVADGQPADTR